MNEHKCIGYKVWTNTEASFISFDDLFCSSEDL